MHEQDISRVLQKALAVAVLISGCVLLLCSATAQAEEYLGTGTDSLVGGDLTDPEDDGDPERDVNYDAIFDSSDEQGFGGGEFAFNVFDNRLGPTNDKWCCGKPGGISVDDPAWVSAYLPGKYFLTSFTVSSANDVPDRDPIYWAIQGSNDGQDYTDIFVYEDDIQPWTERFEVIQYSSPDDFPVQTTSYQYFRFAAFDTILNGGGGAYYQVGEIEFFGDPDGDPLPRYVGGEDTIGTQSFASDQSNEMFGPEQEGVPGWSGRIVTFDEHGTTISDETTAEIVLEDYEGEKAIGAYPVVDMGGGGGTFPQTQAYPNGVADTSQNDFAVEVTADVVIPPGTYTVGLGSDDGGKVVIDGVVFDFKDGNDVDFEDDEIRREAPRGHNWSTGTFTVDEELATTIVGQFYERGGGDSFEIAIIEGDAGAADIPLDGELLGDGTLGWSVTTTTAPLVSADLSASVGSSRPWQIDVNGDTDMADQFVVDNPDPNVFTTYLDIDGVTLEIKGTGALATGDRFDIIDADQVTGTPIITSADGVQTWEFDSATGEVCFETCTGGILGDPDYNGDGVLDALDMDLQAAEMKKPAAERDLAKFDHNGDGVIDVGLAGEDSSTWGDRLIWIRTARGTAVGDTNMDGIFDSGDLVLALQGTKYGNGEMATWIEGDWNGDMLFDSGDLVLAFQDGQYVAAATPAVPEPSSLILALLSVMGLIGVARRRDG